MSGYCCTCSFGCDVTRRLPDAKQPVSGACLPKRNRHRRGGVSRYTRVDSREGRVHIATDDRDASALARVYAGDSDAYAEIVRNHAAAARRVAVVLGAGDDADDVVQEAFVKAYGALGRLREGTPVRPWLLRIVANETRNRYRAWHRRANRERRSALLGERIRPESVDPAASLLTFERRKELVAVLQDLPEPQKLAVTCRYLLDLDERETAAVLGCRPGTVKSRVHRALARMRESLESDDAPAERGR